MKRVFSRVLVAAGTVLLLGSGTLWARGALENQRARAKMAQAVAALPAPVSSEIPKELVSSASEESLPPHLMGVLSLPTLKLELPVLDECTEELLQEGVCRYAGTDEAEGGLVIAGHSYEAIFGGLRLLTPGDKAEFTALSGTKAVYVMDSWDYIPGDDPESLEAERWDLSLFTCTFDGSDRYVLRFRKEA